MSIICPGPTAGSGLTFESSATAGDRTATINTFNRVDATAGDVFITLPASGNAGDRVAVSNEISSNVVFVNPDTGDSIDGVVDGTFRLRPGEVATWYWDGTSAWVRESRSFLDILNFATATGTYLDAPSSTRLDFYVNDASKFAVTSGFIEIGIAFQPDTTDIRDIGTAALKFRDLYLSGDVGSAAAPIDGLYLAQAGTGLVLDTDGDTYIVAPVDDQVEVFIGGVSELLLTASALGPTSAGGLALGTLALPYQSIYLQQGVIGAVFDAAGGSRIVADSASELNIKVGGNDVYVMTSSLHTFRSVGADRALLDATSFRPASAGGLALGGLATPWGAAYLSEGGTGLVLDTDGDTFLSATADDVFELQVGAAGDNAFDFTSGDWRMFVELTPFSTKGQVFSSGVSDCFLAAVTNLEGTDTIVKAVEGIPSTISSSSHRVVLGGHTEPSNSVFDLGQDGAEWKRLWLSEEIVLGDDTGAPSGEASRVKIYASDTNADQMELRAAFPTADVKLGPYLELARSIAEDSFEEVTYANGQVSAITVWTDSLKTTIIRQTSFTYSGGNVATAVTTHRDDSGAVITGETMTETYTYSANAIQSIDRVMS